MRENWDLSLKYNLQDEGGNDNDLDDPGGRTSRGIIQREYNAYRKAKGLPTRDVWSASDAEVAEIYFESYWDPWCDRFPSGVDYLHFNIGVNAGPTQAAKILQRALGVGDDGVIGTVTKTALGKADPTRLIRAHANATRAFYRSLNRAKYIKGWLARTDRAEVRALKMAGVK